MSTRQISVLILSITASGVLIPPEANAATALARRCNDFAASVRDKHPIHYGSFATVPSLLDT